MGRAVPDGDNRERHVCPKCGFVHYLDPKVACGTIAEQDGKFALILRNVDPRKGFWSFPCGFMELDETAPECAVRETKEETGLDVRINLLLGAYSYSDSYFGGAIVVIVYHALVTGGTLRPDDDVIEAKLITPDDIPWDRLAFQSSHDAIGDWMRLKGLEKPSI